MTVREKHKYLSYILLVCLLLLGAACREKPTKNHIIIEPPPSYPAGVEWSPTWNRTNNKISYMHSNNDPNSTIYPTGVYVIDPDGENRTLMFITGRAFDLDWSPDGRWIVVDEDLLLYKISYPDGMVDTLLRGSYYYSPAWSPDGSKIACVLRAGPDLGIYTLNPDGTDYRLLIPYSDFPAWYSADSIIYLNYSQDLPIRSICISDADGQNRRVVYYDSTNSIRFIENISAYFENKRIVASVYIPGENYCLYTYDMEQKNLRRFIKVANFADFSPNGDSILYTDISSFNYNLDIICWDSTGWRQLTEPFGPLKKGLR